MVENGHDESQERHSGVSAVRNPVPSPRFVAARTTPATEPLVMFRKRDDYWAIQLLDTHGRDAETIDILVELLRIPADDAWPLLSRGEQPIIPRSLNRERALNVLQQLESIGVHATLVAEEPPSSELHKTTWAGADASTIGQWGNVELLDVGSQEGDVVKVVHRITGGDMETSKRLVASAPTVILADAPLSTALYTAQVLRSYGAQARVR